jgi:NADH-quinone oxidoreductase subunit M
VIGIVAVVGIVYGAFVAMWQTDFKKLLAYSSVSHMGYVVLGLAAWGGEADSRTWYEWAAAGAVYQMLAHGVTASALFFAVGVVYDRAHHRDVNKLGGLTEPMPAYTGLAAVLFFASMGLPGLCGFVGELFVMVGAWHYSPALAIPAILCTILTAAYLLWTWQRVYLGVNEETKAYPDVSAREALVLGLFAFFAIVLGILPGIVIFQWVDPAVAAWADDLTRLN